MKALPVSDETHARAVRLQEALGAGSDSLIALALDAYAMLHLLETGESAPGEPVLTAGRWRRRFEGVRAGGHYVEVVAYAGDDAEPLASRKAPSA